MPHHSLLNPSRMYFLVLGVICIASVSLFSMAKRSRRGSLDFEDVLHRLEYLEEKEREKGILFSARARIQGCGGLQGFRILVYKAAEKCRGIYKENGASIERDGDDLLLDVVFNTESEGDQFASHIRDICELPLGDGASATDVVVEVFEGSVMMGANGRPKKISRLDYDGNDTDSPMRTPSEGSQTVASFISEADPLRQFQAIERPDIIASSGAQRCHLIAQADLGEDEPRWEDNNILAGSPNLHAMFDGNKRDLPRVRISVADAESSRREGDPSGRSKVVLDVEFRAKWIADVHHTSLKEGYKRVSDTVYRTWVFVKDPELFAYNVGIKHDVTSKRWEINK